MKITNIFLIVSVLFSNLVIAKGGEGLVMPDSKNRSDSATGFTPQGIAKVRQLETSIEASFDRIEKSFNRLKENKPAINKILHESNDDLSCAVLDSIRSDIDELESTELNKQQKNKLKDYKASYENYKIQLESSNIKCPE